MVYLEQAYPRPKYLIPITVAVNGVLLNFGSASAIGKLRSFLYLPMEHWKLNIE